MVAQPASIATGPIEHWYRDPVSCLQSTLATLLIHAGQDPLEALGLSWEFLYVPGDVRPEEYYWPCRFPEDLARSVLPYHSVTSRWRVAADADPLRRLEDVLAAGRLPIIAVDNFHLPFRPAHHDVHAAHLLVVYAVDRVAGTVCVSDAQPPTFKGPIPVEDLLRSWNDSSPRDDQDVFFSGKEDVVGFRWLDVSLSDLPVELTSQRLGRALRANRHRFTASSSDGRAGIEGLRRFVRELVGRARGGDGAALAETYTFGWGPQAQAALHGELLRRCGHAWGLPALSVAGRHVERVAHRWSAVRVQSAHGRVDPVGCADDLSRHATRLVEAYGRALDALDKAIPNL
ncbi:BtrH N-terminal domain-containing protein [Actinomadura viridis]|uniref:BtrH N-terminal domain-containing protein n=1 Tax=Actinomadura viridis TaxID=58110 RepID=UPI0036977603